jgi:hypothetical protein
MADKRTRTSINRESKTSLKLGRGDKWNKIGGISILVFKLKVKQSRYRPELA